MLAESGPELGQIRRESHESGRVRAKCARDRTELGRRRELGRSLQQRQTKFDRYRPNLVQLGRVLAKLDAPSAQIQSIVARIWPKSARTWPPVLVTYGRQRNQRPNPPGRRRHRGGLPPIPQHGKHAPEKAARGSTSPDCQHRWFESARALRDDAGRSGEAFSGRAASAGLRIISAPRGPARCHSGGARTRLCANDPRGNGKWDASP